MLFWARLVPIVKTVWKGFWGMRKIKPGIVILQNAGYNLCNIENRNTGERYDFMQKFRIENIKIENIKVENIKLKEKILIKNRSTG